MFTVNAKFLLSSKKDLLLARFQNLLEKAFVKLHTNSYLASSGGADYSSEVPGDLMCRVGPGSRQTPAAL